MSYAPFRENTRVYKGTTFGFSFTIDEDGSPLDLTTLTKVEAKLFSSSNDVFSFDTDGDLTISGASNNIVSGVASESKMDIAKRIYYLELWLYFSDGSKEAYSVIDVKIIDAESDESQGAHDWVLDIDNDSETVSGQVTSLYAETVDLNQETETFRDQTETLRDDTQTLKNSVDQSETNVSQDATQVSNDKDTVQQLKADVEALKSTVETLRNETQVFRNETEEEVQERIISAHNYYSKELSNLQADINDLQNA